MYLCKTWWHRCNCHRGCMCPSKATPDHVHTPSSPSTAKSTPEGQCTSDSDCPGICRSGRCLDPDPTDAPSTPGPAVTTLPPTTFPTQHPFDPVCGGGLGDMCKPQGKVCVDGGTVNARCVDKPTDVTTASSAAPATTTKACSQFYVRCDANLQNLIKREGDQPCTMGACVVCTKSLQSMGVNCIAKPASPPSTAKPTPQGQCTSDTDCPGICRGGRCLDADPTDATDATDAPSTKTMVGTAPSSPRYFQVSCHISVYMR